MEAIEAEAPAAPRVPTGLLRFLAVGPFGVALGALQYELVWRLMPDVPARSGASWVVSSAIGIAWIHAIHCHFTFRAARGAWRRTILAAYGVYATSIALGALMMHVLVDVQGLQRTGSWLASTAITSLLNYRLLRRLVLTGRTSKP